MEKQFAGAAQAILPVARRLGLDALATICSLFATNLSNLKQELPESAASLIHQ